MDAGKYLREVPGKKGGDHNPGKLHTSGYLG